MSFQLYYLVTVLQLVWIFKLDCIYIGVISNGTTSVHSEDISYFGIKISILVYKTDTLNVFDVFKAVRTLDDKTDVDVILLFDYDVSILRLPNVLKTKNKKLVVWGARKIDKIETNAVKKIKKYLSAEDICGTEILPELYDANHHWNEKLNISLEQRDDMLLSILGPHSLADLVKHLQWKTVFILYEKATEAETSDLVGLLSKQKVLVSLFEVDHNQSMHDILFRIYLSGVHFKNGLNMIVICQMSCTRNILKQANIFDLLEREKKTRLASIFRWLVAVYGRSQGVPHALKSSAGNLDNVAIIAFPAISGNGTEAFNCSLQSIILDILREELTGNNVKITQAVLAKLEALASVWSPDRQCLAYNIYTLIYTKSGRNLSSVGYVEINGNIEVMTDIFPNTKFGYNKRHFEISTLPYSPFIIKKSSNGTINYTGICIDLLTELSNKLNFTYTLIESPDGKWGDYNQEKLIFSGLVGQLQREEVDMVLGPLSSSYERSKVADFSYPFFYEFLSVLVKKPNAIATKWKTLIDPFKWEVLLSIALSLPLMTILVFLMEKYNPFYDIPEHSEERDRNGGLHRLQNSVWYMYGALLCQGGVHLPNSFSGRTLVSSWWLFCIIIVGIYSGNLIAYLTVTKEKLPFETLDGLLKYKGTYKWGTLGDSYFAAAFLKSKHPKYKAIGDGMREFNKTDPVVLHTKAKAHIRKVKTEKYAWIGDKTSIDIAMSKECTLTSIKEEVLPLKYSLGFVKNSPHTDIFSKQILKLHESGLLQIWKRKWWPKANFCTGNKVTEAKPISLMDVQSAFYVCVLGIFLGSVAFIIELVLYKCRTWYKNKPNIS